MEVASENPQQPAPESVEMAEQNPNSTETLTNGGGKREREATDGEEEEGSKKPRVEEEAPSVKLGPKSFESGEDMFNYFYKFLHFWPPKVNINKYEHMVLLDLLKKGHADASKKIGVGIRAFQIRFHQTFKSRCFFVVRTDGTSEDFSFRKCVQQLLPLPENMKLHSSSNEINTHGGKNSRGRGGGRRGGGRGRGHGRRGGFGK